MKIIDRSTKDVYKKQAKVAFLGLLAELPNLVLTIIVACMSNTVLCWIDGVVSASVVLHYILVMVVSIKMAKEDGDKYNYGLERLEVFTSFICDLLISITMLVLLASSIYGLFYPSQPTSNLFWFLILKGCNIAFDIYFVINGVLILKKRKSRLNETELYNYINNLVHDVLILLACIPCYILKDSPVSGYISSGVAIISILYFLYTYIKHIRNLVKELSDVSINVKEQDELYDIVLDNRDDIKKINFVNCHTLNGLLYVDINITFKEDITFEKQKTYIGLVKTKIQDKHPNAKVRLVIEE